MANIQVEASKPSSVQPLVSVCDTRQELSVTSNVSGANVEVDGVLMGKTPLARPIRVARGAHIVGVVAPSHIPERREVLVASGGVTRVDFQLGARR